jgi:hypothetical protein
MKIRAIAPALAATLLAGAAVPATAWAFDGGDMQRKSADERRAERAKHRAHAAASASTSTTGSAYTTRRSGAAEIDTRGQASGPGAVSSSSEGDVYSSTDRDGSQADAYGTSDANAAERPRRPR